ncbi:GNAT family N-acetyltransferase [Acinetobacter zhairhuonensis]|uniref:GNAT family N-acetyltransferase n=1 Tax=Acinetobacter sp. A7.4 TaxID=2919921 RepID=UPI001F4F7C47|nr:GNAT family N-acetyltransferase [Acinetobacter sp. A7.4]MCJ8161535.1 GNAT family N-acetyltransferase [Acinetobacter sp. A7.4]
MNSNVKCSLVDVDDEWDNAVKKFNFDIYHLSGWLKSSALIDGGQAKGLIIQSDNNELLFPLIIREIDGIFWDATSTYGYGGPLGDSILTNQEIDQLLKNAIKFLKEQNCVSWFIRLHPILNIEWNSKLGIIVEHGPTLSSDLSKTEEEHWTETQIRHQRGIKKALKQSIYTKIEDLNESNALIFYKIYTETMQHLNASEFYFFDDSYFIQLAENLKGRILLITAYHKEIPIAASIYTYCKESGIIQYYLGGTLDDYRNLQPAKLITHIARAWGRENQYTILHLGGGLGACLDSLYEYKKGFSSNEHLFKTHRIVVNSDIYIKLLNKNGRAGQLTEYFPLYRKPNGRSSHD